MKIRFDQGPMGPGTWFRAPERLIVAHEVHEVSAALAAMDQAQSEGTWLAGYASYELGYALEDRLARLIPGDRRLPLLCFGVYGEPGTGRLAESYSGLSGFAPRWDAARYENAFKQVHDYIGAGDIYQANLTFPVDMKAFGEPQALHAALSRVQPVGHGALVEEDGRALISRSPELFFRTDADGMIQTRPMKGTQPRSDDPAEDAQRKAFLASDEKNRAENLMIVDLLRNDISRVAEVGSVKAPELFKIESYATVHQMTSLVQAQLRTQVGLSDIFRALFPCGSITGAPKMRAMEILRELEMVPRDIYCGTIGWAAPDGRSEFNVAIRTLTVEDDRAVLNVGGGVVYDSTAEKEYEEALWKARFAHQMIPASA